MFIDMFMWRGHKDFSSADWALGEMVITNLLNLMMRYCSQAKHIIYLQTMEFISIIKHT